MSASPTINAKMTDEELETVIQQYADKLGRAGLAFEMDKLRHDVYQRRDSLRSAAERVAAEKVVDNVKRRGKRTVDPQPERIGDEIKEGYPVDEQGRPTQPDPLAYEHDIAMLPVRDLKPFLRNLFREAAQAHYEKHHLAYIHTEDDGSFTFVCICTSGFSERQNWNLHLRDAITEVV